MENRVFLAIALCVGIFVAWQKFYIDPFVAAQKAYQEKQQEVIQAGVGKQGSEQIISQSPKNAGVQPHEAGGASQVAETPKAEVITFFNGDFSVDLNSLDGSFSNQKIRSYHGIKALENLDVLIGGNKEVLLSTSSSEWQYLGNIAYRVISKSSNRAVLAYEDAHLSVSRKYEFLPNLNTVDQEISIQFKGKPTPQTVSVELRSRLEIPKVENEHRQFMINKKGGQDSFDVSSLKDSKEELSEVHWIGFSSRYFINAMVDQSAEGRRPRFQSHLLQNGEVSASLIYNPTGDNVQISLRNYFGPKDSTFMAKISPRLGMAVDFGWFTIFALPLLQGLKLFYGVINNFGIAIILLTLLVKILTFPLTYKSMKSMKDMQRIQPQLAALREKYANDKESLNREMLQLMKKHGYNPLSGCLPMIIQMPIYIALYNVLNNSIELYGQPFFGWIHDLSQKDPYFVTPVVLGLMMFLQQKMTPNTSTDPAQQKMMMMMPVMFGFMMLWLPSGLTLYMLVNSVATIFQQVLINRTMERAGA